MIEKEYFDAMERQLIEWRRDFHRHPELSDCEIRTKKTVERILDELGIEHLTCADTGIIALIRGTGKLSGESTGGSGGKRITVGIRADMDALPIEEPKDRPYSSENPGVMHACGHDVHTTILLAVAKTVAEHREEFPGDVKLFFQPAEETTGGADRMISEGCLEEPHVDYMLGLHVEPAYPAGQVGIRYGAMYAAEDMFDLDVNGKSCHGAHPEQGTDAVYVSAKIVDAVQSIVSRGTAAAEAAVLSIGTISGGRVRNQIADHVHMEGTIRTFSDEVRVRTRERLKEVAEKTAEVYGAEAKVTLYESYRSLINDDAVTALCEENAKKMLGEEQVIRETLPDMSCEDFAYFAAARPACFLHLGCRCERPDTVPLLHNPKFDIDEKCLRIGAELQIRNILALMESGKQHE